MLVSIALGAAFSALSGGMRVIAASGEAVRSASRLLRLDDALRESTGRIRVPYWETRQALRIEEGTPTIAYWDGILERQLVIRSTTAGLAIETPSGQRLFPGISRVSVSPLSDAAGMERGLAVEYSIGDRTYTTKALYGAGPLGSVAR